MSKNKSNTLFSLRNLIKHICLVTLFILPQFALCEDMQNLRGQRYCEIFIGKNKFVPESVQVYNTIGLNNCPEELWNKLTSEKITKKTGVSFAHLNGPRYWVIDGLKNSSLASSTLRSFGGIEMRDAGVLQLGLLNVWRGQKPYLTHNVKRQTTWVYQAQKPVYELIDPKGNVYIMQSYSIEKVKQTEESLAQLGSKLHLPKGWHFRTRVLEKDAYLTPVNKKAVIIQDEFLNTYQLETPSFMGKN